MAKKLLLQSQSSVICPSECYGAAYEKPSFPSAINETTSINELIASDSWFLFQILHIDFQFYHMNGAVWANVDSCQHGLKDFEPLNVVMTVLDEQQN